MKTHKIGIALSGGGARGFAHLGALQALNERGIFPNIVSGTSAGSIAGLFYAAGISPQDTLKILKSKSLFHFARPMWLKPGLMNLDGFRELLLDNITARTFADLKLEFMACASNLNTGKAEYLNEGNVIDSVIASASIPFFFNPMQIGDFHYADGGIIDNLPIRPLLGKCDKIIAISISSLIETADVDSIVKVAARSFQMSILKHDEKMIAQCDLFIEPKAIMDYQLFDFDKAEEMYQIGYDEIMNSTIDFI